MNKIQTLLASTPEEARSYAIQVANSVSKNDKLLGLIERKPQDFILAVCNAAELGLKVGTVEGFGWIVPYKDTPTFQIGYKGLIELACRTGVVKSVTADVVYENEVKAGLFKFTRGENPVITHDVDMNNDHRNRQGNIVYAYATARLLDGTTQSYIADQMDFQIAQNNSMSFKSEYSPWKSSPRDMYRKTAIKKLLALVPKGNNDKLAKALHQDDAFDAKWSVQNQPSINTENVLNSFMSGPKELSGVAESTVIKSFKCPNKNNEFVTENICSSCNSQKGCPEWENI